MEKIYEIIERGENPNKISNFYDGVIIVSVAISVLPLMFKQQPPIFKYLDTLTIIVFIIDYILRLLTAHHKLKKGKLSFLIYPFTPFAIIDLFSILPSLYIVDPAFKLFRLLRGLKALRVFKTIRFSSNFNMVINAVKKEKNILISIFVLLMGYIFVSALIMFSVEPESFGSFFDAIYWSVTEVTTVGYGDIYPVTVAGKTVSMISSLFGIAMIALPSGVIAAGILKELNNKKF